MSIKAKVGGAAAAGIIGLTILSQYAEQLDDEHMALVADQVEVVKAARNIPVGTPVTKERITTEKVPRKFLPPNPLLESELNIYLGTPLAVNVEEGAMLLRSDFAVGEMPAELASPLVIKTATLRLEAKNPADAGQAALAAVAKSGGYIVSSDIYVSRESQSFSMVARVPAPKFEGVVFGMNDLGTPVERRIRGAGVAADVRQLEKKIGNTEFLVEGLRNASKAERKKATQRTEVIEIISGDGIERSYATKSTTSSDDGAGREIARAEHQLAELEEDLEQLHTETALATIELTIALPAQIDAPPAEATIGEIAAKEFETSSRALVRGAFGSVRVLAAVLPFLLLCGPFFLAAAFWLRRRRAVTG